MIPGLEFCDLGWDSDDSCDFGWDVCDSVDLSSPCIASVGREAFGFSSRGWEKRLLWFQAGGGRDFGLGFEGF